MEPLKKYFKINRVLLGLWVLTIGGLFPAFLLNDELGSQWGGTFLVYLAIMGFVSAVYGGFGFHKAMMALETEDASARKSLERGALISALVGLCSVMLIIAFHVLKATYGGN